MPLCLTGSLPPLCIKLNSRYDRSHSFGHQIIGNSCFTPSKRIYAAVLNKRYGGARKGYGYESVNTTAYEILAHFDRWPTWMWANWEMVALANLAKGL
jgi:hypothetical protein